MVTIDDLRGIGFTGLRTRFEGGDYGPEDLGQWLEHEFDGTVKRFARYVGCSDSHLGKWLKEIGAEAPDPLAGVAEYEDVIEDRDPAADHRARECYYRDQNEALRKRLEKQQETYAVLTEIIQTTVPRFKPVRSSYRLPKSGSVDEEIAMLHISDGHAGEWVRGEHTAGLNEYSWDIFCERKERLIERADSILNGHVRKTWPVKHLFINWYGDQCTHESKYKGQAFRIDRELTEQIVLGAHEYADIVRWGAANFETVTNYMVPGNHGETEGTTLNTDYIAYLIMQQELRDQQNVKFVISDSPYLGYFIDDSLGLLDYTNGGRRFNFIMCHGQQATRHRKTPYYGLDTLKGQLDRLFRVVWDRMMCGHHHTDGESEDWQLVPSWVGASDYSVGKLAVSSRPCQLLNGFHPRQHFTWRFKIDLSDEYDLDAQVEQNSNVYTPHNRFDRTDATPRSIDAELQSPEG